MFKVGDEIVCIDNINLEDFITVGNIYIVVYVISNKFLEIEYNNARLLATRFIKYDYRSEKLLKLKERICLKSVIK